MCQCGCGDRPIERGFKLPGGRILGYKEYDGCADCFPGLAVDLYFFNNKKNEWLEYATIEDAPAFDEYGGNSGSGLAFPIIEVQDMVAAAKEMDADAELGDYHSIEGWLEDRGLDLLQLARRKFKKRMEARQK